MRIRKKRSKITVSATEMPEVTGDTFEEEDIGVPVANTVAEEVDTTQFLSAKSRQNITHGETTGRTWADVVFQYSSNQRYLYLIVLMLFGITFGITDHLQTSEDMLAVGGLTLVSWFLLWLIQR